MALNSTLFLVRRSVLAALFGAAACIGVVALTSPPGPGLDPDSMSYLGAAESLARHRHVAHPDGELVRRRQHVGAAPLPSGLSDPDRAPGRAGGAVASRRRAAWRRCRRSRPWRWPSGSWRRSPVPGPGRWPAALLLATPALVLDHARVLSEPLCLALLAATLALMVFSNRPLLYGLTAAAAGLVRYAAVPAGGAAVLWAFGLHGPVRERVRRAALAALPTAAPLGGRDAALTPRVRGREPPRAARRSRPDAARAGRDAGRVARAARRQLDPGAGAVGDRGRRCGRRRAARRERPDGGERILSTHAQRCFRRPRCSPPATRRSCSSRA